MSPSEVETSCRDLGTRRHTTRDLSISKISTFTDIGGLVLFAIREASPFIFLWFGCKPVIVPSSSTPIKRFPPSVLARDTTVAISSRSGKLFWSLLNSTVRASPCSRSCFSSSTFEFICMYSPESDLYELRTFIPLFKGELIVS